MGRSPESAPLRVMHHSIKSCWRAAVVAMLAVAGTANSAMAMHNARRGRLPLVYHRRAFIDLAET